MNPPPLPIRKRFPWILYGITLVLIVGFAFAPVGSVMLCAWIANAHGCKVDEGSVHPYINILSLRGERVRRPHTHRAMAVRGDRPLGLGRSVAFR
jgi:hypothetical protein